jgi:hypothetical protein
MTDVRVKLAQAGWKPVHGTFGIYECNRTDPDFKQKLAALTRADSLSACFTVALEES